MSIYFYDQDFMPMLSHQAPNLRHALLNYDEHLKLLRPEESTRINLFIGLADVGSPRVKTTGEEDQWLKTSWHRCEAFVWDIDGVPDDTRNDEYTAEVARVLKVQVTDLAVVFSGNGLHFYLFLRNSIKTPDFYKKHKVFYKDLVDKIDAALAARGLPGHGDPSIFDHNRVMRVPGTTNLKKNVAKKCYLHQGTQATLDWDIIQAAGLPEITPQGALTKGEMSRLTVDKDSVLEGCEFLKWTKNKPTEVREPEGYAALSVLGRLDADLSTALHHYKLWTNSTALTAADPERKTQQAIERSGPVTCATVSQLGNWSKSQGCKTCPHYGLIKSPIQIKGEHFIATKDTHFWEIIIDKNGGLRRQPAYDDIYRHFKLSFPYVYDRGTYWMFTGKQYVEQDVSFIQGFIAKETSNRKIGIEPYLEKHSKEAVFRIKTNGTRDESFWADTEQYANFNNGILNIKTGEFITHTPDIGFKYCLSFDYSPSARAPRWEQFLSEVFPDDLDTQLYMEEFMGYCLSGDALWEQTAVLLSGTGANGKSKILEMLEFMAGSGNYAAASLKDLNDANNIHQLNGKLFNSCGETDEHAFRESAILKALIVGDSVTAKQLYKDTYAFKNRAKLLFSVNNPPRVTDRSIGFFRRFKIVPFDQYFDGANNDKTLLPKLQSEAAGIYNRIAKAYASAKARRAFTVSATIERATAKFKEDQDYLGFILKDLLEFTGWEGDFITTTMLMQVLKDRSRDDGHTEVDAMLSPRPLRHAMTNGFRGVRDGRRDCPITGKRGMGYVGVRLKDQESVKPPIEF